MTWVAMRRAAEVRRMIGLTGPVEAARVCAALAVPVYRYHFAGDILGAYSGGAIGVRPLLPRPLRDHIILHEIGHHLLDGPDADLHFWRKRDWVMWRKSERRAEEFAYFFALPGDELMPLLSRGIPAWEIEERYCRPVGWAARRILLARDEPGMTPYWRQDWAA
jgi:hypothetical protein